MNGDASRPDPDRLLDSIEAETKKTQRGKLKIFFGSSAGVGKTYAMLAAAHEKRAEDVDVVIGIVETHNRPETEKLIEGLNVLAPLTVNYRGVRLQELDLDAALMRKPQILLVDELAHTNAPGSRHPKRWNDVMELLDAGIDVYTTLNVQHIESLADVVAGTTGIWVKETVPDSVFDAADDVVLIDIDADDLLERLNEGKVYVAPQIKARAAENFFKKNNLIALREVALRRTAERVDAQKVAYDDSEGIHSLPVADKIMVCVGPDGLSSKLVRSAKRMALALKAPWAAVYVENSRHYRMNDMGRRRVEAVFRLVERVGGKTVVLQGDNAAAAIIAYARENHFTKIIVGKPIRSFSRLLFVGSFADSVIRRSDDVDVYVVTAKANEPLMLEAEGVLSEFDRQPYLWSLLLVFTVTALGVMLSKLLSPIDQALIYLTGIVVVAARLGRGPSLLYSLLSVILFQFFFLQPLYRMGDANRPYLLTFLIMLVTGYLIADLASRLRLQVVMARQRETQTRTLYQLTRELASTRGRQPVSDVVARHVAEMLDVNATIWLSDDDGHLSAVVGELPTGDFIKERSVLQWCFDNGRTAGRSTATMPSAEGLYLPLLALSGACGVLGVLPKKENRAFTLEEMSLLETFASLLASALERVRAGERVLRASVEEEGKRLRKTLLEARGGEEE